MGRMANCRAGGLQRALDAGPKPAPVIATMRTGKPLPALVRRSLLAVRHVVANSHEARDNLVRRYGVPADRITVIHNALVFRPDGSPPAMRAAVRADEGASAGTFVLLCVAMFRPEKNQAGLIEAVSGLPRDFDWQLWLAGDGPTRAACERLAADRGLTDRVRFLGWQADPSPLYAAADLAVHASGSESLSNFIIEAQAAGMPAVVFDAQGIKECFLPGQTGEVIPRDNPDAFRAAIVRYCRVPAAERAIRAESARAYARMTFDPAHQIAAYLSLLARIAT
jgi:glycosyltransferase involved in cell wall biosynthesis